MMDRSQGANLVRMPEGSLKIMGFLMTTESQDLGLKSHQKDGAL